MILASCSLDEAKKYRNKLVLLQEKDSKKPEEVLLNIVTDEPDVVISKGIGVAKCITTTVSPTSCPDSLKGNVFRVYRSDDLDGICDEVDGVVPLIVLEDGFSDMRVVFNLSVEYPNARFTGGNLLGIPGLKIGRYDKGKEKLSSHFNGMYDIFREVELSSISVQEVMPKTRSKCSVSTRVKKVAQKKPTTKSKRAETFEKFFGGCTNEF